MTSFRSLAMAGAAAVALLAGAGPLAAQSFSDAQRKDIQRIVREYLIANPEVLQEVVAELEKRQVAAEAEKRKGAVTAHRDALFNSKHQVNLGNPKGDVTLVEFFDYNCGYCKRALADMLELLKADPNLKIVLKEFPVLGPQSVEAAQVAVAVNMQDKSGKKYLEFHRKLLNSRGQIDKARALAAAKESGLDMARLEKDLAGKDIGEALDETVKLAEALGISGTPTYVVGQAVIPGAIGVANLKKQVEQSRAGR
jgi:protein-disulfide isomerase